ncbi:MAG: ATP-binding cassette domain-containing protein [Oligoflexus sp.]|nr:ATP-binding cassette domain-containing protein [Oligoflexus sp.]
MNNKTLKRMLRVARPELTPLSWGLVFLVISSASALAYPQLMRWMIDNVLTPKKLDMLLPVILGLFLAFLVQGITSSLRYFLFTMSGERIVIRLRQKLYERILAQEVSFFDLNRTGDLMSRLSSDCQTLQNAVSINVSMGLRNLGQVIGGLGFMFYTSWRLSALMLIMIPPIAGAAALFGKKIRKNSKIFYSVLSEGSTIANETISGVRTVKSFVQEAAEIGRYRASMELALVYVRKGIVATTTLMTVATIFGLGAICFVLWYGGREVILGTLTSGDMTQFLLYLMLVAIGVGSLGGLWGDFMAAVGASERVFDIIEREPEHLDVGKTPAHIQGVLEFTDVHFHYPTRTDIEVLRGINFKVQQGQAVALVGSSGGGKTTIASLLPRYYEPTLGQILLDGEPIHEIKLGWLREQIGVVSQEPVLISTTIEENIRYGKPEATDADVEAAAQAANALEFIRSFPDGMKTRVGEKGLQLSGGQKQRVAIARALLKNPKILILDEATSNLDTASEYLVQEALQRLMEGRTTLIIAHRLATVRNADNIFVIQNGTIVQSGTHDILIADKEGLYFELLQRQIQ